jgi:hypothetical protein
MPVCSLVTLKLISNPMGTLASRIVCKDLRLVDWKKRFNAFDLDDQFPTHEQVDAITAIEQDVFVSNW